ncbi:SDR family oxidoreductase [bacterium]|nr:SDR family oxidoreductase [bacterium]
MIGRTVYVTGGGGYVGSALVPALLDAGYAVKVLDLFIYGREVLDAVKDHPKLELIEGDIRDADLIRRTISGSDAVIHLACISNDPSFELDPELGKSINLDAMEPLVLAAKEAGVKRFIYASSSSVYGIKDDPDVTEDLPLEPLTDYSRFKVMGEEILFRHDSEEFVTAAIRPATVCGYAPRQRLDVIVNILTNHAVNNRRIRVFGGDQLRPNIHIRDMVDVYLLMLEAPAEKIRQQAFNAGYHNHSVRALAEMVRDAVGPDGIELDVEPTDDNRSYHVSSQKLKDTLGFSAQHSIEEAVRDLVQAFEAGKLPDSMTDTRYFNVKRMNELALV